MYSRIPLIQTVVSSFQGLQSTLHVHVYMYKSIWYSVRANLHSRGTVFTTGTELEVVAGAAEN